MGIAVRINRGLGGGGGPGQPPPPLAGTVTISGAAEVGATLSAVVSANGAGAIAYTWIVCGAVVGNAPTYTPTLADIGHGVVVVISRADTTGALTSAPTAPITDPLVLTGTVSITGTTEVGATLTADTSALGGSGAISYQWARSGVDINGATGSTYIIPINDLGLMITVRVTRAGNNGSVTSAPVGPVDYPVVLTGTVSITGIPEIGETLTADTSLLGGSGAISYQWKRNGTPIVGATGSTYVVPSDDVGLVITVTVTRFDNNGAITSAPVGPVPAPPLTGSVSITGFAVVGATPLSLPTSQTLSVDTSALGGSGTIYYQWLRNGAAVAGETGSTYAMTTDDAGATITVEVMRGYHGGSVISAPHGPIVPAYGTFVDSRDGQEYEWLQIGRQIWMRENLNYNAPGSFTYDNDPANGDIYGRLYNWATAMNGAASSNTNPSGVVGVSPPGWHLPSLTEWQEVVSFGGGDAIVGMKLKATSGWEGTTLGNGTDDYGFKALPAGWRNGNNQGFEAKDINAFFRTVTEYNASNVREVGLRGHEAFFYSGYDSKLHSLSIRSIKDAFVDPRDGQEYPYVKIGNQVWMAKNLNFNVPGSRFYNDDPQMGDLYGRLYTWDEAMIAAPPGWHLPSNAELDTLMSAAGGYSVAGTRLKSTTPDWGVGLPLPVSPGTDIYGFTALPAGGWFPDGSSGDFGSLGEYGWWWTTTPVGANIIPRYINYSRTALEMNSAGYSKSCRLSVRLIRD